MLAFSLSRAPHVLPRHAAARWISSIPPRINPKPAQQTDMTGLLTFVGAISDETPDTPPIYHKSNKWRTFKEGDIVTPNELTPERCLTVRKFSRRPIAPPPAPVTRRNDIFRQLNLDPLDFSLNPSVLYPYMSEMGKIYGRNITGLSSSSQRKLGKAIRRARMIGVLPQLSRPTKFWVTSPKKYPR